jgi:hypothetical protein
MSSFDAEKTPIASLSAASRSLGKQVQQGFRLGDPRYCATNLHRRAWAQHELKSYTIRYM